MHTTDGQLTRGHRPRVSALVPVLLGIWVSLGAATPASAHAAGGGGASGVAGARGLAVGLAFATVALVSGPLFARTGPVDQFRGALGRLAPLAVIPLAGSIDLGRPVQVLVAGSAAAVAVAPSDSRWRPLPGVLLLVLVTAGSTGDMGLRDRSLGALHVVAGAVWLGLVLEVVARWLGDPAVGRRLLHRLSGPALGILVAVATTGTLLATEHLGDARLALGSWWGRGLAAKIALVVGAALLGALVRTQWAPRLEGTALTGAAVLGLLLAVAGSPLSGAAPLGPLLSAGGASDVLIAPMRAGRNTVVVRTPAGTASPTLEVDGRPVVLEPRRDGLLVAEVELAEGRHRILVGEERTTVTLGPDEGGVALRATLPDRVTDPDCLDGLAGLAAASAALSTPERPVRFELEVGGDTCGPPGGFPERAGAWADAARSGIAAMRARGTTGPLLVVADASPRARSLVEVLRASDEPFTEVPAADFDAVAATQAELGSLVLVATEPQRAWPVVQALSDATGATVPVVLAPWLLDASVLTEISQGGVSVLVAAHRDPTAAEAIGFRGGAARTTGGGWPVTAAGLEAYVEGLEQLAGTAVTPARPGVYSAARVNVMPADTDHPSESGWAQGVAMIRVG